MTTLVKRNTAAMPLARPRVVAKGLGAALRQVVRPSMGYVLALLGMLCVAWVGLYGGKSNDLLWAGLLLALAGLALLFAAGRQQSRGLHALCESVERLARGDLREPVKAVGAGDVARAAGGLERLAANVSSLVARIRSNGALILMDSDKLTGESRELAGRTDQQAANLEETSASVEELVAAVKNNAEASAAASQRAKEVSTAATEGAAAMQLAMDSVSSIQQHSNKVGDVVRVIDALAFQTNLLALNAAVEAANAGAAGRGFAVVAAEVRKLAKRSADAAAEIGALIAQSTAAVEHGVTHIGRVHTVLSGVVGGVADLASHVQQIALATKEQSLGLSQVGQAVASVDSITQQNAHMSGLVSAASSKLTDRAAALSRAVSTMQLRQGSADEAREMVARATALIRERGEAQALEVIGQKDGGFRDRDLYVFVFDRKGCYRVVGGDPSGRGRKLADVPGIDAVKLVRDAFAVVESGGGWVEYSALNPTTGKVLEKMSYVQALGSETLLGCGIYKDAVG